MPSLRFCDLTPSDAAEQVKRMLGHAPSQQAAHTFWSNLTTLGQIQQNQRLEIDSQGVFRLESTASRKLKTLSPFASSRSITELHPAVLAVLYRAQIESFFPTPQLSKVLGSKLAITENQTYERDGNRRSIAHFEDGYVPWAPPRAGNYGLFGTLKANADRVVSKLAQANSGLANMLAGYRSQSSWFNSKNVQAESVSDLVKQAEKPLMPFDNADNCASIAQLLSFKFDTMFDDDGVAPFWKLDLTKIANSIQGVRNDVTRVINTVRSKLIVSHRDSASTQASLLLWGHHGLRESWVYDDLDFFFFDDDINDVPSSRVLEEQVDETQCNVSALRQWGDCVARHQRTIQSRFPSRVAGREEGQA